MMVEKARARLLAIVILCGLTASSILVTMLLRPDTSKGKVNQNGQPIEYNHRLHTQELEIECVTCHRGVETAEQAGPPALQICLECHETPITDSPEEHRIQEYASSGSEIAWVRLTFLPDHVYFSHRRHVAVASIGCSTCHGPMETRTTPPRHPLKRLSMSDCMDCHERNGASTDCNACHR